MVLRFRNNTLTHTTRQILSFLHLSDLFAMSRTSSNFRAVLMGDLQRCMVLARKRSGLPLPRGMSESFLATLLYGTECFVRYQHYFPRFFVIDCLDLRRCAIPTHPLCSQTLCLVELASVSIVLTMG